MCDLTDYDITLKKLKDFRDYLDKLVAEAEDEELDALYDKSFTLAFNGHDVTIPFDAVVYNGFMDLLTDIIKEY